MKVGIDVALEFCMFCPRDDTVAVVHEVNNFMISNVIFWWYNLYESTYVCVLEYFVEDGYFICVDCVYIVFQTVCFLGLFHKIDI